MPCLALTLQLLQCGSPQQVLDGLPGLLAPIMTMRRIARYYSTPARMTGLFSKLTNQMMRLCRASILAQGKLWDQDRGALIAKMRVRCLSVELPQSQIIHCCLRALAMEQETTTVQCSVTSHQQWC
jgi:hypothetical protein